MRYDISSTSIGQTEWLKELKILEDLNKDLENFKSFFK